MVPGRPSPLPCTNMSHPVGPAVLPKDGRPALRADKTDYSCRPVPSEALSSPPRRLRSPLILSAIATHVLSLPRMTFSLSQTPVLTEGWHHKAPPTALSLRTRHPTLHASYSFSAVSLLGLHRSLAHIRSLCPNDKLYSRLAEWHQ